MKKKSILFLLFEFAIFSTAIAGSKEDVYHAYISGDMHKWEKILIRLEQNESGSTSQKFDLVNYYYGYIGWCLYQENMDKAKYFLDKAEKIVDDLELRGINLSLVYSYQAAFNGYKIALSPWKAPFLGGRCQKLINKSLSLNHKNYFAHIQDGNMDFYRPRILGGSKTEAIRKYKYGLEIMEQVPSLTEKNWNYLNIMMVLAQAYNKIDNLEGAKKQYQRILEIEPEFSMVKNEILPGIDNMIMKQ